MEINFIAILGFTKPLLLFMVRILLNHLLFFMLGSLGLIQELNKKFKVKFGYGNKANVA